MFHWPECEICYAPGTMGLWSGMKKPRHGSNSSALQKLHGKPRQKPSEHLCLRCRYWISSPSLTKKRWLTTIDTVTVHADGRMTFKFQGGTEIEG